MLRLTLAASLLLLAGLARADVAPPPGSSCEAQKVGELCRIAGDDGRCEKVERCGTPARCDGGGNLCPPVCTQVVECKVVEDGGCTLAPSAPRPPTILWLAMVLLLAARPRRR